MSPDSCFFNSRFESGNLKHVRRVSEQEYHLYLAFDQNNERNQTQWFYFSVMNIKKGQTVTLSIMNLYKDDSMYGQGQKPYFFSTKANSLEGKTWRRGGFNISYYRNDRSLYANVQDTDAKLSKHKTPPAYYQEKDGKKNRALSTLTFSYTFDYDKDCVYFAHF